MVHLTLEPTDDASMPKDCYVSVRVGETQKLSRLSGVRTFRFPQAANKSYGKIEVFQRIGAVALDMEPVSKGMREILISCEQAGFGTLGLRAAVEGNEGKEGAEKSLEDMHQAAKSSANRVKSAKDYLHKHGVEARLAEAMQMLLRERPADPMEFLAVCLLPKPPAPPPEEGPPPDVPEEAKHAAPELDEEAKQAAPELPELDENKAATLGLDVRPLGEYFASHIKPAGGYFSSPTLEKLYGKFPVPKALRFTPDGKFKWNLGFGAYYSLPGVFDTIGAAASGKVFARFPAYVAATERVAAAAAAAERCIVPIQKYCAASVTPFCKGSLGKLYNKFPNFLAAQTQAEHPGPFHLKPSTATWLTRRPARVQRSRTEARGRLQGLRAPATSDERCEVERVLSRALLELTGEFSGTYYPLAGSSSVASQPGGMSAEEAEFLEKNTLLFEAKVGGPCGRGVFATVAGDAAAWINEDDHIRFVVLHAGPEGSARLARFQSAMALATAQDGYELCLTAAAERPLIPLPAPPPGVGVVRQLHGLQELALMCKDERCEAERVICKALLELTGELAGQYFPLPSSDSFPARPGGMSSAEACALAAKGLLFKVPGSDPAGRGIFATVAGDAAAIVNNQSHVHFVVLTGGKEGTAKLVRFQQAVALALAQDGHELL